jgi:hypothetical protein
MHLLKPVVERLEDVEPPVRPYYQSHWGKFHLSLDGAPHGYVSVNELAAAQAKVGEFRTNNIQLARELDTLRPLAQRFEGLDPDVARAAILELETLRRQPSEDEAARVADLEARLSAAESVAASTTLRSTVAEAFSKAGGRPEALDFIVSKAAAVFTVENGALTPATFSPERPGERLSLHEFMAQQVKEASFAFAPSSGGGASGSGGFSAHAGVGIREVVDPTPQQLGQIGAAIKAGTVRVRYSR